MPAGVWVLIAIFAAVTLALLTIVAVHRRRAWREARDAARTRQPAAQPQLNGHAHAQGQPGQPSPIHPADAPAEMPTPLSLLTALDAQDLSPVPHPDATDSTPQSPVTEPHPAQQPAALPARPRRLRRHTTLGSSWGSFQQVSFAASGDVLSPTDPPSAGCARDGALLCQDAEYVDWGPGVKRCFTCGARPIFNRGCSMCSRRMCEICFRWHRHCATGTIPGPLGVVSSPRLRGGGAPGSPLSLQCPPPAFGLQVPSDLARLSAARPAKGNWAPYRLTRDFHALAPVPDQPPAPTPAAAEAEAQYYAENMDWLKNGGALFYFTFLKGTSAKQSDLDLSARLFQLTAFEDESAPPPVGNNAPHIDPNQPDQRSRFTFVINKATYCIAASPRWSFEDITPQLIASHFYQRCVQPSDTDVVVVEDERAAGFQWHPNTFRIRKPIIPGVFKFTCQFRVTELSPAQCRDLSPLLCDGMRVDRGLLLERTKRDPMKTDMIAKGKSVLLYHRLAGGGVLVTNITTGVATKVPWIISTIVDKLSFLSAKDVTETVNLTRAFFADKHYPGCAVNPPPSFVPNTQQE
eukprot:TRINITY_DN3167_c0_g1_i2.p1 TRINITY_DN3167_c0_g1~~TRINITY_DN3167_c0_g1_i2.p1  ORF type:complete len:606 (+),score=147.62 TRINITY_DN3167_c0_g1_i2:88-1818(+)